MDNVEDCLFGNGILHDRFIATTEILAKLVSSAPRSLSLTQLEEGTGRPAKELEKLCANLLRANLLCIDPHAANKWALACSPSLVTLEDVFRCVMNGRQTRSHTTAKTAVSERPSNDVDLLVTQAMIAINQSVFKHLRRFSLDRLKITAAGMFPAPRRALRDPELDDTFSFATAGRESGLVSPAQFTV